MNNKDYRHLIDLIQNLQAECAYFKSLINKVFFLQWKSPYIKKSVLNKFPESETYPALFYIWGLE